MTAAPRADVDSQSYWDALRQHRIVLQQCEACGKKRFPPMPSCPWCGTPGGVHVETDARGRVYSWVTLHRQLTVPRDLPYTVATIQLDDGPRALGRLDGAAAVDAPVEPFFVDHDDWTELRFRVVT